MTLEEFVKIIANEGVSIATMAYLIYWMTTKLEKKLDEILEKLS